MTPCPIISIVSELRHAHSCMSSYQSNSRSSASTTRVGVKVQMTQFYFHFSYYCTYFSTRWSRPMSVISFVIYKILKGKRFSDWIKILLYYQFILILSFTIWYSFVTISNNTHGKHCHLFYNNSFVILSYKGLWRLLR